jgi:hypothetical protein
MVKSVPVISGVMVPDRLYGTHVPFVKSVVQ